MTEPKELDALIDLHAEQLTEEQLIAITKVFEEEEEEEEAAGSDEEEVSRFKLMVKFLGEILQNIRSVTERLLDTNLVMEHYLKVKRELDDVKFPYKELHRNLQQPARQLSITEFFHPCPST